MEVTCGHGPHNLKETRSLINPAYTLQANLENAGVVTDA